MGIMVYSLLWAMHVLYHQPYLYLWESWYIPFYLWAMQDLYHRLFVGGFWEDPLLLGPGVLGVWGWAWGSCSVRISGPYQERPG